MRAPSRRRVTPFAVAGLSATLFAATLSGGPAQAAPAVSTATTSPAVTVTTIVAGLANPWDVTFVGDLLLYDLRAGQVWSKRGDAAPRPITITGFPTIYAQGEAGLLGMVADPGAATNQRFYTCQAVSSSGGAALDVRVLPWKLTSDTTAVSAGAPVVTGIPLTTGRHTGCRLRFGFDGKLYVGTGDAATGTNPQNLASLGGKVLRVGADGAIPTDNPFYAQGGNARYVFTYGHRNVQGLAVRPGTAEMWSAEHGPDRDDEVNLLVRGGNYGWDPVPGYNESGPMTDLTKFPNAQVAKWSSGSPTVATSGASFVQGSGWGQWQGWMAVALLKGQGVYLMRQLPTPATDRVVDARRLPQTEGLGRIRVVQQGPDGSLYVATANGADDRIVRITPTATPPTVRAGQLVSPVGVALARTGSAVTTFVRSVNDTTYLRRSTDDGRTWGRSWTYAGVTTSNAPTATSSRPGRVDLFTRGSGNQVVHTWYDNGIRKGSTPLGGIVSSQSTSSPGDGTIDVWAVAPDAKGFRNHFDGARWSGWRGTGGLFTSALSGSADHATTRTLVTGRGLNGQTYENDFTSSGGRAWVPQSGYTTGWSTRALGDTWGAARIAVSNGPDRNPVVGRGPLLIGVRAEYSSGPDVVTRPDGTFLMAGRGGDNHLWIYDARPGGYLNVPLGGDVR